MTRGAWLRGFLAILVGGAVVACDGADLAPAPGRTVEAASNSPPLDTEETPYKHGSGGADANLVRAAATYHSPHYARSGRLEPVGDTRCLVRRAARLASDGQRYGIVATWASRAEDCSGPQAIVLTLSQIQSDDMAEDNGRLVIEIVGPETTYASGMKAAGWIHGKPSKAFMDQRRMEGIDDLLKRLTALRPLTADRLPPWPEADMQPLLPDMVPDELTFQPFADRQTYEAARRQKAIMLCWKPEGTSLRCWVEAQRRRPTQVLLFAVHGFNAFVATSDEQAVQMMTAEAP